MYIYTIHEKIFANMIGAIITDSKSKTKRYKVQIYRNGQKIKTLHFGSKKHENYTMHKDKGRRLRYWQRHGGLFYPLIDSDIGPHKSASENWQDPFKSGFWSRWLLWNKKTLKSSASDIKKRFDMNVTFTK